MATKDEEAVLVAFRGMDRRRQDECLAYLRAMAKKFPAKKINPFRLVATNAPK